MLLAKDKMFSSRPRSPHPFPGQKRTWYQSNYYSNHPQENRVQYGTYEWDTSRKAGTARLAQKRFKPSLQIGERYYSCNKVLTPSHDIHMSVSPKRITEATTVVKPTVKATSLDDLSHRLTCRRLRNCSEVVPSVTAIQSEMILFETLEEGELSIATSHQPQRSAATMKLPSVPAPQEFPKHFIVLDSYSHPDDCDKPLLVTPVHKDEYPGIYDHPEPFVDLYAESVTE